VLFLQLDAVRDTGIEPVTSSVSGKRSPAELIALGIEIGGGDGNRNRPYLAQNRCLTCLTYLVGTHRVRTLYAHLPCNIIQLVRIKMPVAVERHGSRCVSQ
jgi:hypothetical protein